MNKFFIRILISFIFILGLKNLKAQDISFSQFYANSIYLNPAMVGSRVCPNLFTVFTARYLGLESQRTFIGGFSFDMYLPKGLKGGGVGTYFFYEDQAQAFSNINFSLLYSHRINITKKMFLAAGFQFNVFNKSVNSNNLTFEDQINQITGAKENRPTIDRIAYESISFQDIGFGLFLNHTNYFFGVATQNVIQPNISFLNTNSRLYFKLTLHAGGRIVLKGQKFYLTDFELMPNILYRYQNGINQFNVGVYATKLPFVVGVWYKVDNAVTFQLGFQHKTFSLGYSYDLLTSEIVNTQGTHEITLRLTFKCIKSTRDINSSLCPSF